MQHEPSKFVGTDRSGVLEGEYHFDSRGSVNIKSRGATRVLGALLGLGFDFVTSEQIIPADIAETNPRYRQMTDNQIPMFYAMHLRNNPANFVSGTEGIVRSTQPYQDNGIQVVFADGGEIITPKLDGIGNIEPNEHLTLLEVNRSEKNVRVLNWWTQGVDKERGIRGGQVTFKIIE